MTFRDEPKKNDRKRRFPVRLRFEALARPRNKLTVGAKTHVIINYRSTRETAPRSWRGGKKLKHRVEIAKRRLRCTN